MPYLIKIILTVTFVFSFSIIKSQTVKGEIPCIEIKIMCAQRLLGNYIVNNQPDYLALLSDRSTHTDCGNYQLPVIDFTKYTLLGMRGGAGGCKAPKIEHNISHSQNVITFHVKITEYGICKIGHGFSVWCLIPKVKNISNIKFTFSQKFEASNDQEKKLIE